MLKNIANFIAYHLTELKINQLVINNLRNILTEGFGGDPSWVDLVLSWHCRQDNFEMKTIIVATKWWRQ